jgi:glycosyltransferase involved in cell wall biosynthesis
MRVGVFGFGEHAWTSVERTRRFYLRALGDVFELCFSEPGGGFVTLPEVILNFSGRTCWEISPRPDCPLVFALHGGPVLDHAFLRDRIGNYETTDLFIVNCASDEAILRELVEGEPPHICQLPLPVDTQVFFPRPKSECRAVLPIEADSVIGFVARLIPHKNLHVFLHALRELAARLHPYTVHGLVIGDYWVDYPVLPYRTSVYPAYIEALIENLQLQEKVTLFPGSLTDEQLATCYGAMDVLFHPTNSLDENFGYVPVEAMACGIPVVGAAYGGLKDTVRDGETGFLAQTWTTPNGIRIDSIAAIDALHRILCDASLRHQMGEFSARHARESFSLAVCAGTLQGAINEVATKKREGWAKSLQRREVAGARDSRASVSSLPPVGRRWEEYLPAVTHYVSRCCPSVCEGKRVKLTAPILPAGKGVIALDDPAWPAMHRLDAHEAQVVSLCASARTMAELHQDLGFDLAYLLARVQRLVDLGVLVCSE